MGSTPPNSSRARRRLSAPGREPEHGQPRAESATAVAGREAIRPNGRNRKPSSGVGRKPDGPSRRPWYTRWKRYFGNTGARNRSASGCARRGVPSVSHEWIYQWILEDKRRGGDLYHCLRHCRKRRKRYGSVPRGSMIPDRPPIEQRPAVVETRSRLGDWEADTVIGCRSSGVLVSLTERRSRLVRLAHLARRKADDVAAQVIDRLQPLAAWVLTVTSDNGTEFGQPPSDRPAPAGGLLLCPALCRLAARQPRERQWPDPAVLPEVSPLRHDHRDRVATGRGATQQSTSALPQLAHSERGVLRTGCPRGGHLVATVGTVSVGTSSLSRKPAWQRQNRLSLAGRARK